MPDENFAIDEVLAAALRGAVGSARQFSATADSKAIVDRINYHGIAGLLCDMPAAMAGWPGAVTARLRHGAVVQTMWELRHHQLLNALLAELAAANIVAILLKGTALAYDLYPAPATRVRGDSDLLIAPADLAEARHILSRQGFARAEDIDASDTFSLQEVWTWDGGGAMNHHIDLHWQLLNSPALGGVLPVAECAGSLIPLPRHGPDALAMDRVRTLIHTCIHRAMNSSSPYFVDGRTYYGGDRLIWLTDIRLLWGALSDAERDDFCRLALAQGVSAACLDGLLAAQRFLGMPLSASVRGALDAPSSVRGPAVYLHARQAGRAWQDLQAIPGVRRKLNYLRARAWPTPSFIRRKYPQNPTLPLPVLYARRLFELLRPRPTQSPER